MGNGTPEQVHLTWGDDPATSVVVSWGSPGRAVRPRVRIGQRVIPPRSRPTPARPRGKTAWIYHAWVPGLRPGATYAYAVTADNDANFADPFTSTFRTAPAERAAFRFTCSGDLARTRTTQAPATRPARWSPSSRCSTCSTAGCARAAPGAGWRDFGNGSQLSAASRPWMPVPGDRDPGDPGVLAPYLARHALPANGAPEASGRWYSFRVAAAVFACLDSSDLDSTGPGRAPGRRADPVAGADAGPGTGRRVRGLDHRPVASSGAAFRGRSGLTWVFARTGCHCSTGTRWTSCSPATEQATSGPSPGGGRTAATRRPHAARAADSELIDTSTGTVHLLLGSGGYGIAVFDVAPGGEADDQTSIAVSCYRTADSGEPAPGQGSRCPTTSPGLTGSRSCARAPGGADGRPAAAPPPPASEPGASAGPASERRSACSKQAAWERFSGED